MNFIDSKILSSTNNSTEIDIFGTSKITIPKTSSNSSNGDSVTLGIRPEHLLVNQDGDASWESKVFVVEKLGSGTFLYLEKDGEPLVVETEGDSNIKVGDTVKLDSQLHVVNYLIVTTKLLNNNRIYRYTFNQK